MKRLLGISVVLTMAILVMLAGLMLGTRTATAASTNNQLSIEENAQFVNVTVIDVQVDVKCSGGTGNVDVGVTQTPAQSSNGVGASSKGTSSVNCDGNEQKLSVEVSVTSGNFSLGRATAQAFLFPPSGSAFDIKQINIIQ